MNFIKTLLICLLIVQLIAQTIVIKNTGCNSYDDKGNCKSCSIRFYKDSNNICQPVNPNCNTYNQINGNCLSCYLGYGLLEGSCLPGLSNTVILDPFCNTFQNNVCVKCSWGYYFGISGKCMRADLTCKSFDDRNGLCTSCYPSFSLQNGKCIRQIKQTNTDVNCFSFNSQGQCTQCSKGFYFLTGKCQKINDNCKDFDMNALICRDCYPGYKLDQLNECIKSSQQINDPNCAQWNQKNCVKCSQGSIFNTAQNKCTLVDTQCKQYNKISGVCLSCYDGYSLNINSICIKESIAVLKKDQYCAQWKQDICLKCSQGSYFNNQRKCTLFDPLCKTSNQLNGECLSCYLNYQLNDKKKCIISNKVTSLCIQWNNQLCTKCSSGTFLNSQKNCEQVNPYCKTYNSLNGACLTCYDGYQIFQNRCIISVSTNIDPYCKTFNGKICSQCSLRYFKNSLGICKQVNRLCNQYSTTNGQCLSCFSGYQILNGQCIVNLNQKVNNLCAQWKQGFCLKCSLGAYFNNSGVCVQSDPNCQKFNQITGFCLSCYSGYALINNGCQKSNSNQNLDPFCAEFNKQTCIKCSTGYYFSQNGKCATVNPLCATYNTINGNCLSCFNGYQLNGNLCLKSQVRLNSLNCAQFINNICIKCSKSFYLNQRGQCTQVNPFCKSVNESNGNCLTCYDGYILSSNSCVIKNVQTQNSNDLCAQYYNNICLICSSRSFFDFNGKCQKVSEDCKTFDNFTGKCKSCYSGFILNQGQCQKGSVIQGCSQLDQNQNCLKCSAGYYLSNKKCIQIDTQCAQFNYITNKCSNCYKGYTLLNQKCQISKIQVQFQILNCLAYNNNKCIQCYDRFYLSNNQCNQVNVFCKTYDQTTGICTSCYSNFTLDQGQCKK